jgi:hypothetical protein
VLTEEDINASLYAIPDEEEMINQSVEPCWGIIETDVLLL